MNKDSQTRQYTGNVLSFVPTGEYYFTRGIRAYDRHDFHSAEKYMRRAMQLEPTEPMILFQLAIIYTEVGKYEDSNVLLHKIMEELDEDFVECYYLLANNYAYLGLFEDAYAYAQLYMENDAEGEFREDTENLLELLSLEMDEGFMEEDWLIVKQEKAKSLLELGEFSEAIENLNDLIAEYPEFWPAYNNLALAYFYMGDMEKAATVVENVLSKSEGNLYALCNKMLILHFDRRYDEADLLAETLQKVKPMLTEQQYKLGVTFALTGHYEYAYHWFRVLQKNGFTGDESFFYWLSHAAFHSGRLEVAETAWEKLLFINPGKNGEEPWADHSEEKLSTEKIKQD